MAKKQEMNEMDSLANALEGEIATMAKDRYSDEDDFTDYSLTGDFVYWKPSAGATLRGLLLGRFMRQGKSMGSPYFYRIELTKPCEAQKGREGEQQTFEAQPGDFVNVDERAGLKVLLDLANRAEHGDRVEVILRCGAQTKTANGRAFWPYSVKFRILGD